MDEYDVPFLHRDKCAALMIEHFKCMNKGYSFCLSTKDKLYECQYEALKQRLSGN